jgi:hypothetical protein
MGIKMALDLVDYERKAREAVQAFWGNREAARQKQLESGKADQGERAGVTAGKNMDGFVALVLDIVKANGLAHAKIHQQRAVLTLPGYFRPAKLWDLIVMYKGVKGFTRRRPLFRQREKRLQPAIIRKYRP